MSGLRAAEKFTRADAASSHIITSNDDEAVRLVGNIAAEGADNKEKEEEEKEDEEEGEQGTEEAEKVGACSCCVESSVLLLLPPPSGLRVEALLMAAALPRLSMCYSGA